jgi:hypothetical protein
MLLKGLICISTRKDRQISLLEITFHSPIGRDPAMNVLLSLKLAALSWMLNLTGVGTVRAEAIRLPQMTATQGHYLVPFARMMLVVAAIRDGGPQQARDILSALSEEFPRNSLYARERECIH